MTIKCPACGRKIDVELDIEGHEKRYPDHDNYMKTGPCSLSGYETPYRHTPSLTVLGLAIDMVTSLAGRPLRRSR